MAKKNVTGMLNESIRIGFLLVLAFGLCLVTVWLLSFLYQEISGTGKIVIDQFNVVSKDGKADDALGKSLAQALQARLSLLSSNCTTLKLV